MVKILLDHVGHLAPNQICLLLLLPALVNIVLIFAFGATKFCSGILRHEHHLTMLAGAQRLGFINQHKAEHELDTEQQGMKIPNDCRLIPQGYAIGWGYAAKGRHALLV